MADKEVVHELVGYMIFGNGKNHIKRSLFCSRKIFKDVVDDSHLTYSKVKEYVMSIHICAADDYNEASKIAENCQFVFSKKFENLVTEELEENKIYSDFYEVEEDLLIIRVNIGFHGNHDLDNNDIDESLATKNCTCLLNKITSVVKEKWGDRVNVCGTVYSAT
ncbi:MAG: hypothetical protein LBU68_00910 [Rickettsiales bacterium]|nr:hypothetical protein [Rickettsiales bacterium]